MKRATGPGCYSSTEDLRSESKEGFESLARGEFGSMTLEKTLAGGRSIIPPQTFEREPLRP